MSRVHDALRRAAEAGTFVPAGGAPPPVVADRSATATIEAQPQHTPAKGLLELVQTIPFEPSPDGLLINPRHPHNAPSEEFRTLRTRLNHMQSLQPIHTAVVTSPSPAEGK